MRKLTFTLDPKKTETPEQHFRTGEKTVTFLGTSKRYDGIVGLKLNLDEGNGNHSHRPLTDTRNTVTEDISKHSCCSLSWTRIDKEYVIQLEVN